MLIAEISNCHFGNLTRAKELIRAANDSGADLIKGQAFVADDIRSGSMPRDFYEMCAFTVERYLSLIDYARSIGNDLFYSIFSDGMQELSLKQAWHKLAGAQTMSGRAQAHQDIPNMIISVPKSKDLNSFYKFKHAELLYVTDYRIDADAELENITHLSNWLGRPVGYSDHRVGIEWCAKAYQKYGAEIIEKHFCLKPYQQYKRIVYRDSVHGVTPRQFEQLAKIMSG